MNLSQKHFEALRIFVFLIDLVNNSGEAAQQKLVEQAAAARQKAEAKAKQADNLKRLGQFKTV